ncbi:MAG: exodeoxyribonuclease VII large subunit [Bacillota bacterium]|nr:exodeoxyribonuclease VII large subunit [Bacillota bacterium]
MAIKPVSVSQLNNYINRILSTDPILVNISVTGEISNLTRHSSGHWYFSLKDENSTVRCFLPRDRVKQLRFDIDEGMKIIAYGMISVYERGGSYSLNIKSIDVEGEGDLKKAFDLLFKKLSKEGLFDEDHKREIPEFPKTIGVVTSPTGAAIRDIVTTIKRRNPLVNLILYPALVQGPDAATTVVKGIEELNNNFKDIDVLIVGRGGGSAEDLWTFNEESVARAIYNSKIPVISAVGHEVDVLISDYVADLRAATPTAAAELATVDIAYYKDLINSCCPERMYYALKEKVYDKDNYIKNILESCNSSIKNLIINYSNELNLHKATIDGYNPLMQLDKGYAALKNEEGKWINSIKKVKVDDKVKVLLKDGELECLVLNKQ